MIENGGTGMADLHHSGNAKLDTQTHSRLIRTTHWITALSILIMIGSGWRIYDSAPVFSFFQFPTAITIGGDVTISQALHDESGLANALLWHFAAMWLLGASFLVYLVNGIVTKHFRRDFLPLSIPAIWRDFIAALRFRLDHRLGQYNAVQKLAYLVVLTAIAVMIVSGLAIWKPVQFQELTWLCGGYDNARIVHFTGMAVIVGFILVHVALTLLVPKTLVAMLTGKATMPAHHAGDPT